MKASSSKENTPTNQDKKLEKKNNHHCDSQALTEFLIPWSLEGPQYSTFPKGHVSTQHLKNGRQSYHLENIEKYYFF